MASPHFFTREDDLRFRRVTWLLSLLEGKATNDTTLASSDMAVAEDIEALLEELTWLTNLLIRNHEVVAVMPHRDGQRLLVVEPQCNKEVEGTTNPKPQISLHGVEETKFHPYSALPNEDEFKHHLQIVISSLKEIKKLSRSRTGQQSATPWDPKPRGRRVTDLHVYVLRSCFRKISARVGYHCKSFRKPGTGGPMVDYSGLFRPMPGWEQTYMLAWEGFPPEIQEIYKHNLDQLLPDSGNGPQVDPAILGEDDWGNYSDISPECIFQLQKYRPNEFEGVVSEGCSECWKTQALPDEEGFYLTTAGRKAYHEILTACFGNALLGLKLMSELETKISEPLQEETFNVVRFVAGSFYLLYHLAYSSPLLGIHLQWLLTINPPTASKQHILAPDPDLGSIAESEALGEIADTIPDFGSLGFASERFFPARKGPAAAVLRWLRLIALHAGSVERLVNTTTCSRLEKLNVEVLQASLPQVDVDMEPLDVCLKRFVPATEEQDSFSKEVRRLSKNDAVEKFGGTWHPEAVLLGSYLLSHEGLDNDEVPQRLRAAAATLYPHIVATSGQCCRVCKTLFRVVSHELKQPFAVIGSHDTYSACSLPPWLPKRFANKVANILESQLQATINKRLGVPRSIYQFNSILPVDTELSLATLRKVCELANAPNLME